MDNIAGFENAKRASVELSGLDQAVIDRILLNVAEAVTAQIGQLMAANDDDIKRAGDNYAYIDRLRLTPGRISNIAIGIQNVAALSCPVGELLEEMEMPNGLHISRIAVPLGVVGMIYEARPNVTLDAFALCFKTRNAVVLKGGSEAVSTNKALLKIIREALVQNRITPDAVSLLPAGRESADMLMNAVGLVDVLIPRGSQNLINHVRDNSKVPVIETGAGVVHLYADQYADLGKLKGILFNAKTRRPGVCNALDCLLVHQSLLPFLAEIVQPLKEKEVIIYADGQARSSLAATYPFLEGALPEHYGNEFLSLKMAIKTVDGLSAALNHIRQYSSGHSEAIVSENSSIVKEFLSRVDSAAVYANASPAFTDGAEFGLGGEIGISTQKLHARGPFALAALTSYKWLIQGNGQVRK